jgi:hypothetical protein
LITKEKMERYRKFAGDLDNWVRSQKRDADEVLNGAEWSIIDKAMQRLKLQKSGFASKEYRDETERVLSKTFADAEAIQIAREMV